MFNFDIDLGNQCSRNAYNWAKKTFDTRKGRHGEIGMKIDGAFSNALHFGAERIGISSDGIGTKIELAERMGIYDTLGFDLLAMTADDLVCAGFIPTNLSNILDVDVLDYAIVDQLMRGLHDAAIYTNIAVTGGEIAELGNRIGGYGRQMHFNWCATAIGTLHPSLSAPIDGSRIAVGDAVFAIQSPSFRSNGFSVARRVLESHFGADWHHEPHNQGKKWGEILLNPSLICTPLVLHLLNSGIDIRGVAHITGGGIIDNFGRVLKVNRLGACLDSLFEPLDPMLVLMDKGALSPEKAYLYWNMGNALLFVVPSKQAEAVLSLVAPQKTYQVQVAGEITNTPIISLRTKVANIDSNYLTESRKI